MINETIVLLTYFYKEEDTNSSIVKHLIKRYVPAYLPWELYLTRPLQNIFSKVLVYDFLKRRAEIGLEAMNQEIVELARREKARYVLWTSFYYDVYPSTLNRLRQEGAITVGWFFDDEWRFESYSKFWIPYLDYCVTNAVSRVDDYVKSGGKPILTIPNTGVAISRDWTQKNEQYDVTFVGSRFYANRSEWINKLAKTKFIIDWFGEGWSGYVPFERMVEIFWQSKINLNFSKAGPEHTDSQIKGRVFQVCMAGGFLLTEYAPGLEHYFEIGKEIDCFKDIEELEKKLAYYLKHEDERRAMARAGWEKATRFYSSNSFVGEVFTKIKVERVGKELSVKPGKKNRLAAGYQLFWGKILLKERRKAFSRESFKQALHSSYFGFLPRYYLAISYTPYFLEQFLYNAMEILLRTFHMINILLTRGKKHLKAVYG